MATPPNYTTADFLAGLQGELPTGPIWPRDPEAVLTQTLAALVQSYTRNAASAANLLVDTFPATTFNFLTEWEKTLGLPDPCTPLNPSIAERQAAVRAKFVASGGQSPDYFIGVAAALGYVITITELAASSNAWQITAPMITVSYFKLGVDVCGDFFWTIDNSELECRLRAIMPADKVLTFVFS